MRILGSLPLPLLLVIALPAERMDQAPAARTPLTRWWRVMAVVLIVATLSAPGCVRRRLTIRSNPPGAMVHVDNQHVGFTPCSVDFTYYGTREIRLSAPGYETLTVNQPIPTPWYQMPPLDFFSDNFAMRKIRDNRTVSFNLQPQIMTPVEEIIRRGDELRARSHAGGVTPASGTIDYGLAPPLPAAGAPPAGAPLFSSPPAASPPAALPPLAPPPSALPNFAPPALPGESSTPPPAFRY